MGKVKIEHNNKPETFKFFLMLRMGQTLLGMPGIETLHVSTISCNRMYLQTQKE